MDDKNLLKSLEAQVKKIADFKVKANENYVYLSSISKDIDDFKKVLYGDKNKPLYFKNYDSRKCLMSNICEKFDSIEARLKSVEQDIQKLDTFTKKITQGVIKIINDNVLTRQEFIKMIKEQ